MNLRLHGIVQESLVDGSGIRLVLFTQGCARHCPHCHNPDSWAFDGGREYTMKEIIRIIKKPHRKLRGITFSGGEPFLQAAALKQAADAAHAKGWDVWTYTGYTYEQLISEADADMLALLDATDVLADGPYLHGQRALDLPFRGSYNQRLIDMNATRKRGEVVLLRL